VYAVAGIHGQQWKWLMKVFLIKILHREGMVTTNVVHPCKPAEGQPIGDLGNQHHKVNPIYYGN